TSPGVADFYQGSELWDLRLVDPDNRGAIDFRERQRYLEQITGSEGADPASTLHNLQERWQDGRVKLYLIRKALCFRRDHSDLFRDGEFVSLKAAGCHAQNVVAFLRRTESSSVLVAIPRWSSQLQKTNPAVLDWCDTSLSLPACCPDEWTSILSPIKLRTQNGSGNSRLMMRDVFNKFPVALLQA